MKLIKTNINYLMEPYLLQDEELKDLVVKIPGWEIKDCEERYKKEIDPKLVN